MAGITWEKNQDKEYNKSSWGRENWNKTLMDWVSKRHGGCFSKHWTEEAICKRGNLILKFEQFLLLRILTAQN